MTMHAEFESTLYRTAVVQLDDVAKKVDLEPDLHDTHAARSSSRFPCRWMTAEFRSVLPVPAAQIRDSCTAAAGPRVDPLAVVELSSSRR